MAQWLELLSEPPLPPPNKLPFAACAPSRATLSRPYVHPGFLGLHLERSRPRPLSWGPPKDTTSLFSFGRGGHPLPRPGGLCPGAWGTYLGGQGGAQGRPGMPTPAVGGKGKGQLALRVSVPGWLVAPGPLRSKRPPPWASFLAQSQTLWGAMAGEAGGQLGLGEGLGWHRVRRPREGSCRAGGPTGLDLSFPDVVLKPRCGAAGRVPGRFLPPIGFPLLPVLLPWVRHVPEGWS